MEDLYTFEGHIQLTLLPSGMWNVWLADEVVLAANPVEGFAALLEIFQGKDQFPKKADQ